MEKNERNKIKSIQQRTPVEEEAWKIYYETTKHVAQEEIRKKNPKTTKEKRKITKKASKQAKNRIRALVLASLIGFGSLAAVQTTRMLNAGDEDRRPAQEHVLDKTEQESFRESLKVDTEYVDVQYVDSEIQEIQNEIENLDSKEDVLKFWKKLYVEEYQKLTGDNSINQWNIKMVYSNQSSVYVLDDGQIVTRGSYPEGTEAALRADGQSFTGKNDVNVWQVVKSSNNEIIDGMTTKGEAVTPGDNYNELKDNKSALVEVGVYKTKKIIELYDIMEQLEQKPGNEYLQTLRDNLKSEIENEMISEYNNQQDKSVGQDKSEGPEI